MTREEARVAAARMFGRRAQVREHRDEHGNDRLLVGRIESGLMGHLGFHPMGHGRTWEEALAGARATLERILARSRA